MHLLKKNKHQKSVNFSMMNHLEPEIKKEKSVQRLSRVSSSHSIVEDLDGSVLTKSGIEQVVIKKF